MASQFILVGGVHTQEPVVEAPVRHRRRAQLAYTPGVNTESVEQMMIRLHQQFPKDMKRLAE